MRYTSSSCRHLRACRSMSGKRSVGWLAACAKSAAYQVRDVMGDLELSICTGAFGMYHTFGNPFAVEVGEQVDQVADIALTHRVSMQLIDGWASHKSWRRRGPFCPTLCDDSGSMTTRERVSMIVGFEIICGTNLGNHCWLCRPVSLHIERLCSVNTKGPLGKEGFPYCLAYRRKSS